MLIIIIIIIFIKYNIFKIFDKFNFLLNIGLSLLINTYSNALLNNN